MFSWSSLSGWLVATFGVDDGVGVGIPTPVAVFRTTSERARLHANHVGSVTPVRSLLVKVLDTLHDHPTDSKGLNLEALEQTANRLDAMT